MKHRGLYDITVKDFVLYCHDHDDVMDDRYVMDLLKEMIFADPKPQSPMPRYTWRLPRS